MNRSSIYYEPCSLDHSTWQRSMLGVEWKKGEKREYFIQLLRTLCQSRVFLYFAWAVYFYPQQVWLCESEEKWQQKFIAAGLKFQNDQGFFTLVNFVFNKIPESKKITKRFLLAAAAEYFLTENPYFTLSAFYDKLLSCSPSVEYQHLIPLLIEDFAQTITDLKIPTLIEKPYIIATFFDNMLDYFSQQANSGTNVQHGINIWKNLIDSILENDQLGWIFNEKSVWKRLLNPLSERKDILKIIKAYLKEKNNEHVFLPVLTSLLKEINYLLRPEFSLGSKSQYTFFQNTIPTVSVFSEESLYIIMTALLTQPIEGELLPGTKKALEECMEASHQLPLSEKNEFKIKLKSLLPSLPLPIKVFIENLLKKEVSNMNQEFSLTAPGKFF